MFDIVFDSIISADNLIFLNVLICTMVSIILGLIIAVIYMLQGNYSKNFITALILLPPLVQCVILVVNGNLGAGIAVAGAFSLVRFRSAQGNAREICAIFFAMAIGLATGMGYVAYAVLFTVIVGIVFLLVSKTKIGEPKHETMNLKIVIPENLNYTNAFDDIFEKYTKKCVLDRAKTTNLGSMYELSYQVDLKNDTIEKDFLDEIRCRNGNLTVCCGRLFDARETL